MRKFKMLCLMLLMSGVAIGQISPDNMYIQGVVLEDGNPVEGHEVCVSWTTNTPNGPSGFQCTATNPNGWYWMEIIDGSVPGPTVYFEVFTQDSCNNTLFELLDNNQGTVDYDTANFDLCSWIAPCEVEISYVNDPVLGGNILTANSTGTGPFTYQWDSGETTASIFPAEPVSGTYCVTVTDDDGCTASSCYVFNNIGCSVTITAQQDPIDSTLFTFTASNLTGVAPYTYEWWPQGGTTQSITTQLTSNTDLVCVEVTDANGCIAFDCDTVYPFGCFASFYFGNGPNWPVLAGEPVQGYFTGSSTQPGNIYEWTVDGSANYIDNPGNHNPIFVFPNAGDYEVCVTVDNGNGCSDTYCSTITVESISSNCSVSIGVNEDSLNNVLNAEVWAVPTGVAPFIYQWSNGSTAEDLYLQDIQGLETICVTITDANGCTATSCVEVGFEPGNCEGWISGLVNAGSANQPLDEGMAYLITFDANTNLLTAVDSMALDSGNYFFFGPVDCGTYLVKAAATSGSQYYNDHIPTYFGNSPFWGFAQDVTLQTNSQMFVEVNLISSNNPGGPGFIGGDVTEGANKTDPGDPLSGLQVMIFDLSGNAIAYAYTDGNGEFGFPDLAWGTYQVYVEVLGVQTIPAVVTIGPDNPSEEDVHIFASETLISTGIAEFDFDGAISDVYPNPVVNEASVTFNLDAEVTINVSVLDLTGRMVSTETMNVSGGENRINVSADNLKNGYYFLNIQEEDGSFSVTRKFMRID
ncbi:carboxypeptidase regulatory-like domain-containing protein [Flavobacteriales bacterium]|nr:carboxypeptidase regulatory-like domain-containing protein [Flavobacteriales bacterium]